MYILYLYLIFICHISFYCNFFIYFLFHYMSQCQTTFQFIMSCMLNMAIKLYYIIIKVPGIMKLYCCKCCRRHNSDITCLVAVSSRYCLWPPILTNQGWWLYSGVGWWLCSPLPAPCPLPPAPLAWQISAIITQ